ncbi:MAG: 16S rRNA (cytosine(1402)-N(4))-methyltransferase RsmH [Candidatus Harrisonbacteria bacterium]|nr:16S rRNA (cytosine(1402)-N(4))-methyltransferase RsmH [Candidatus Harrisonbacteria bacterium]
MTHIPVLLKEVIELLDPKEREIIIDGTAGSGGHAKAVLQKIGETGQLLLVDWDKESIANLKKAFASYPNVFIIHGNYAELPGIMAENNFPKADGLLLDLGFSSEQLEKSGRGFSFQKEEPLLMTYSDASESLQEFLKYVSISELTDIIRKFGEERYAERIAEAIYAKRRQISSSQQLGEIIKEAVPKNYERGRIHPATRTFQALRIYLNKELENLEKVLSALDQILTPGGRAVIISFHSLEDRIVKNYFRELAKKGRIKIITKKPTMASQEEISQNPRSRSAKLRAAIII